MPICAEVFKSKGVYNPKRLFGVTTLDVVRASRFVSEIKGTDPANENITVVGGHSGVTIVPLFSQSNHPELSSNAELINRVQFGGDEVVKAKDGTGSATLSMAYAGARFALTLLQATVAGQRGSVESTYVHLDADPASAKVQKFSKDNDLDYFALDVEFGPEGVEKILELPESLTQYEKDLLDKAIAELKLNIAKGVDFVKGA